ncbi:MAG: alcohol dehydrogenase catalytic domain-containing protein [Verrucomicrobiota bacterium]
MTDSAMRAVLFYGPGDLRLIETPIPQAAADEVVVKIHTALTCGTDFKAYRQGHPVLLAHTPSPFGHEMAGTINQVGKGVTTLREGDRVVVLNSAPCDRCYFCEKGTPELCDHLDLLNGAYADYIRVPAQITRHNVHPLPENLSFAEAALTEPFACALHAVDKMQLKPGETIAVIGAGNMARLLVFALKAARARVLVLGRNAERLGLALAAGADEVIDLTQEPDGIAAVRRRTENNRGADGAIEAVGEPETWALSVGMVRKGGRVCLFGGCAAGSKTELDAHRLHYNEITLFGVFHHRPRYVRQALELLGNDGVPRDLFIQFEIPLEEVAPFFATHRTASPLKAAVVM